LLERSNWKKGLTRAPGKFVDHDECKKRILEIPQKENPWDSMQGFRGAQARMVICSAPQWRE
jgi:hypothetical protein